MSSISNRRWRGLTLAETLASMVVLALFSTFAVAVVGPIISAPNKHQAKIDTIQAAAQGLYRLQSDLRMANVSGVFVCSIAGGTASCSPASSTMTQASVLAVTTPLANHQVTWDPTSGLPLWAGVDVYCLTANNQGSNDLKKSFQAISGLGAGLLGLPTSGQLNTAVGAACSSSSLQTVAPNVLSLSVSANGTTKIVGLKMVAQTTIGGRTNETSYESDTYARN